MAHIVVLTHAYERFHARSYLLRPLSEHWRAAGHRVTVVAGLADWPEADLAVLHVDLSLVPAAYLAARDRYPVVLNGAAEDIRKRRVSTCLVRPGDGWTGPVIVKTDLNCGGLPEKRFQEACLRARGEQARPEPGDGPFGRIIATDQPYPVLPGADAVPAEVWENPGLVVERFLPEQDQQGYWTRAWVFLGDRERCTRYLSRTPVVKSGILAREPAPVPDELRAERRRLGFDYGKFDFVMHQGRAILLDANRTPAAPPQNARLAALNAELALGIESWVA